MTFVTSPRAGFVKFCRYEVDSLVFQEFKRALVALLFQFNFLLSSSLHFGAVTRMEELQRLQASRRGHRAHLRKLIKKAEEIVERRANIDEFLIAAAKSTTDQLQRKRDMLRALNEKNFTKH